MTAAALAAAPPTTLERSIEDTVVGYRVRLPDGTERVQEGFTPPQLRKWIKQLPDHQVRELPARPWWYSGRPEQFAPPGRWRWWLICAGRGWGKTRTGAEWVLQMARTYPGCRIALVAPTFADGRDTMVEGESGILACVPMAELLDGSAERAWNRSTGELRMANGSRMKVYTSERARQLRGPQFHFAWGDEPAYWLDANKGTAKDSTWSNLNIALRLKARRGWPDDYRPRAVLTTTPRRVALLKIADEAARANPAHAGLMQRSSVLMTRGSTLANYHNLADDYRSEVVDPLFGTELGKQELGGHLLEDVEGALWTSAGIEADRVATAPTDMPRLCVAFDPAGGDEPGADEHGITVQGATGTARVAQFYVLADRSMHGTPEAAARRALRTAVEFGAGTVVYEKNQGQQWIPTVLRQVWDDMLAAGEVTGPPPQFVAVNATVGKALRAQPVQALYEQHRVHHVGLLEVLEEQQTTWVPGDTDSPDRLDALVHGITWLYGRTPQQSGVARSRAVARMPAVPVAAGPRGGRR